MLNIGLIVYWDMEAKKKTERNNAGKLEPGYSAQFDAAASTRHEQEKSIRPTRLLSKGLPPWERVERIKAFEKNKKKVAEVESELEWQLVGFFVRSSASDLKIRFIFSVYIPDLIMIPDTFQSLFLFFSNTDANFFFLLLSFQVSNEKKERLTKMHLIKDTLMKP